MPRTVDPSCAVRVLIRRYIESGMSKVVLMAHIIDKPLRARQYGFMDLWICGLAFSLAFIQAANNFIAETPPARTSSPIHG